MKYYFLLILTLLSFSCYHSSHKSYQTPNHEKIADRVTASTVKKIEAETGLKLIGIGGGMMEKVRMMSISFNCYETINLGRARELLVYCTHKYLSAINTDDELRPYLIHYPFTAKDIKIEIYIYDQSKRDAPIGALTIACEINGELKYKIEKSGNENLTTIYTETYEEALTILETNLSSHKIRKNIHQI